MNPIEEAKKLIEKSEDILILPPQEKDLPTDRDRAGDIFCSGLSLFYTLKKMEKKANFLVEKMPDKFSFLVSPGENFCRRFSICVNTSGGEVSEMQYEKNEKDLKIHLLLERGELKKEDISFLSFDPLEIVNQKAQLLITVGARNLQDLGNCFLKSPQFFYETPIINIDNLPSNENFGEVNMVQITTPSLSEIVCNFINSINKNLLDKKMATCLLAGLISASQNFQSPKLGPKTFETASLLLEKGADHQKIIKSLYKTKSVSQIKLLGRVLEKLDFLEDKNLHFVSLERADFQKTGACPKDLGFVIEELKLNFWKLPSLLLLWENHASPSCIKGVFYSPRPELISQILENFEGIARGEGVLFLIREPDLNLAKEKVLKIL